MTDTGFGGGSDCMVWPAAGTQVSVAMTVPWRLPLRVLLPLRLSPLLPTGQRPLWAGGVWVGSVSLQVPLLV